MNFYAGLPADLYDRFFPEPDEPEITFFAQHISSSMQPALEVACGTGRLMIPLLKRGYAVEGFDASFEMLAQCKVKALQAGFTPLLYRQFMQDLALPKKYGCIFCPLASFQQISDHKDAQRALHKFHDHLLPSGKLVMYLYLPWHNAPIFGEEHEHQPVEVDNQNIRVYETSVHDPIEQLIYSRYRYEIREKDRLIAHEEKELTVRWYSRYEFSMMLERAGFSDITVQAGYEDNGPFDVMLFSAQRNGVI